MFQKSSKKRCLSGISHVACPAEPPVALSKATPTHRHVHMLAQHLRYTLSSSKVQSTFDYQNVHSESN